MAEEHKVMTLASWAALVLYIVIAAGASYLLYSKVAWFRKPWGFLATFLFAVICVLLHNAISGLFHLEEPVFFSLAFVSIGVTFVLFVLWLVRASFRLITLLGGGNAGN